MTASLSTVTPPCTSLLLQCEEDVVRLRSMTKYLFSSSRVTGFGLCLRYNEDIMTSNKSTNFLEYQNFNSCKKLRFKIIIISVSQYL